MVMLCRLQGVELLLEHHSTLSKESVDRTARTLRNDFTVRNIDDPNPSSSPGKRLCGRTLATGLEASTLPSFFRSFRGCSVAWWMVRSICDSRALSASGTMKGASVSPRALMSSRRARASEMRKFMRSDCALKYAFLKESEYTVRPPSR